MAFSLQNLRRGLYGAVILAALTPVTSWAQEDRTVAIVNGDEIKEEALIRLYSELPQEVQQNGPQVLYPLLLEEVIGRKVVVDQARDEGFADDAEVKERLRLLEDELIYNIYVLRQAQSMVDDAAVQAAYDDLVAQRGSGDEINASHILVETEEEAKEIIQLITDGTPFADLARERSKDPGSGANGGDLGWSKQGDFVPAFEAAAFALEPNTFTSEPVQTNFGWHVILLKERRTIAPPPLEDVAPRIRQKLAEGKAREYITEQVKGATIQRFGLDGTPIEAQPE